MKKEQTNTLVYAILMIVIGILFCFSLAFGTKALSIIIGASCIAFGLFLMTLSVFNRKSLVTFNGIAGALALALGILFIVENIVAILVSYIPWALIVLGATFIIDILLRLAFKVRKNTAEMIFILILGIVMLALGLCLLLIENFKNYASLIFGIVLILQGAYIIVTLFAKKEKSK